MTLHTSATWPARDDRRIALLWLAIFWIFVGVGFGFDLHNYFHEKPAVPFIVHIHAIATTGWLLTATTLVLLVETGNVAIHRRIGWYAAAFAALVLLIAPCSELSWQALNLATPNFPPPAFLSLAFSGPLCMAILLAWGLRLRRNPAAHRRVLMLAIICISDAGFSRMVGLFHAQPPGFLGTYFFFEGGSVLLIALMLLWDWKQNRLMKQSLYASALIVGVGLFATALYFNPAWQSLSHNWLVWWSKHLL